MCKSRASNARWFLNSAEIDVSLHKRFMRTHSQKPSVSYYDAPVMRTIQVPPRAFETVYCRNEDAPLECQSLSTYPTFSNAGVNSFEVRQSTIGEGAGRGGGFLELQLGQQLPLTGMLCGVQLEPCHDLSAWLLSSSCVGLGGDHGSHGDGCLV